MKKILVVVIALLLLLPAANASAGLVKLTFNGGENVAVTLNSVTKSTAAGSFTVVVKDATGIPGTTTGQSFETYCVDLLHWMYNGQEVGASGDLMSEWGYEQTDPSPDYPRYDGAGQLAAYLYTHNAFSTGVDRVALQLAIWEALFESAPGAFSATTGNVRFSGGASLMSHFDTAGNYLRTALDADWAHADTGWLRTSDFSKGGLQYTQDYFYPVPEPASMLLLGSGLVGLARVARRRRNRS